MRSDDDTDPLAGMRGIILAIPPSVMLWIVIVSAIYAAPRIFRHPVLVQVAQQQGEQ